MCNLSENIRAEGITLGMSCGIEKGITAGEAKGIIEAGYDFGLSESDILSRLQDKLNVSLQTAQKYLEKFGKQTV